jgi:hypothetical protein
MLKPGHHQQQHQAGALPAGVVLHPFADIFEVMGSIDAADA